MAVDAVETACFMGSLQTLQAMHDHELSTETRDKNARLMLVSAARFGREAIVDWLLTVPTILADAQILNKALLIAVELGRTGVVDCLFPVVQKVRFLFSIRKQIIQRLIMAGDVARLQHFTNPPPSDKELNACTMYALCGGYIDEAEDEAEALERLAYLACEVTNFGALIRSHDFLAFQLACGAGRLGIAQWVSNWVLDMERGAVLVSGLVRASRSGHVPVVEWILATSPPVCVVSALNVAANPRVLQVLLQAKYDWATQHWNWDLRFWPESSTALAFALKHVWSKKTLNWDLVKVHLLFNSPNEPPVMEGRVATHIEAILESPMPSQLRDILSTRFTSFLRLAASSSEWSSALQARLCMASPVNPDGRSDPEIAKKTLAFVPTLPAWVLKHWSLYVRMVWIHACVFRTYRKE